MYNSNVVQLEKEIADVINRSGLEISVINLILTKLANESAVILNQIVQNEQEELLAKQGIEEATVTGVVDNEIK